MSEENKQKIVDSINELNEWIEAFWDGGGFKFKYLVFEATNLIYNVLNYFKGIPEFDEIQQRMEEELNE